jgi:hypothetical protein
MWRHGPDGYRTLCNKVYLACCIAIAFTCNFFLLNYATYLTCKVWREAHAWSIALTSLAPLVVYVVYVM